MTVGMPYKALGQGSLVAGKYRIQSELGRGGLIRKTELEADGTVRVIFRMLINMALYYVI